MIEKIKALGRVSNDVDIIKNDIKEFRKDVKELRSTLDDFYSEIERIKEFQKVNSSIMEDMRNNANTIHNVIDDFKKEIYDFKLMKNHLQKEIMQRFESELNDELRKNIGSLKETQEKYDTLKNNIFIVSQNVSVLLDEINKFKEISKHIKESDFHLNKYYRNLEEMDKEKLRLLKKIDNLERMIAKSRRNA